MGSTDGRSFCSCGISRKTAPRAITLSARTVSPFRRATLVDRVWRATGAIALTRTDNGFDVKAARPPTHERPWARLRERGGAGRRPL
jgi:hypothetical protein